MTKARSKQSSERKGDEPRAKRPSRRLEPEQRRERHARRRSMHVAEDVEGDARAEFLRPLRAWARRSVTGRGRS